MGHVVHVCACVLSPLGLLLTPWAVAHQAPLSMGFPRQEYWSGLPFSSAGYLPNPRIEPMSPALRAVCCIVGGFFTIEPPGKLLLKSVKMHIVLRT